MRCVLCLGLLALTGCGGSPHRGTGWTSFRDPAHGITVAYPSAWHRAARTLTPHLVDPVQVLAVATYPLRGGGRRCGNVPENAARDLGRRDVLVWITELRDVHGFLPRAHPVVLGPATRTDLGVCARRRLEEHYVQFRDHDRGFYAHVVFGADASAANRAAARRVLESLRVRPPRMPAGWRVHHSVLAGAQDEVLVASSFPIPDSPPSRTCEPRAALDALPPDGAWLYVFTSPATPPAAPGRPSGASILRERAQPYECMGRSRAARWREGGQDYQAHLYLGRRATARRRAQLRAVFDSFVLPG